MKIVLANGYCCGRPLISKGLLRQAKANAANVVEGLHALAEQGMAIVALEPSCTSALKDDYKGLLGNDAQMAPKLEAVIARCCSFDEFLQRHLTDGKLPLPFNSDLRQVLVHGHCHQKALVSMKPTMDVLRGVAGFEVSEIPSGCCGIAGAFGYEKEHYDFSMKIGELHLLPSVKAASEKTLIVASGMSCRSQIEYGAGRRALHLAEAIAWQLKDHT